MAESLNRSYAPLEAVTVIERARSISAAYCGRILADLGARVFKCSAAWSNTTGDAHDPVSDELLAWLDHGKHALAADAPMGADLLICDSPDFDRGEATAIICITPFGMAAYGRAASELVVQHASGFAFHQAMPVSDPENLPPRASSDREAAMAAGVAAGLACVWAVLVERRVVVDFSVCDYLSHLLIEAVNMCAEPRAPMSRRRAPGQAIAIAGGLVWLLPCSDGSVMISPREDHQWQRWVDLMGNPAWASEPDLCASREVRTKNTARLQALMAEWSGSRTRQEVFAAAQNARIACFPVSRPIDLMCNPQLDHREFFDRMTLPDGREAMVPGLPFRIRDAAGAELARARRFAAASSTPSSPAVKAAKATAASSGTNDGLATDEMSGQIRKDALAGVRVVDFSWVMAGPLCTKMLGAMGAEVIKIESSTRAEFKNRGGWFDILNNNKRSCSVNITTAAGQEVVRRLAERSQVLVENFSAGVLRKYGLAYEDLSAIAPSLIYVSASGLGRTGPLRDALAYGTLLQAFSGRCALVGTPNPSLEAMGVLPAWTDPVTAFWEALGIASAIVGARRTGRGAYIDISMLEGTIALLPESLLSAQGIGPSPAIINRERGATPSGCYRCSDHDGWVAFSVRTEAQWRATCTALGLHAVQSDPRFRDATLRERHFDEIDAVFRAQLLTLSSGEAESKLRSAGVPASKSRNIYEVVDDLDIRAAGLFPRMAGGRRTIAMPWTDEDGWRGRVVPGPALGADNDWVLESVLELSSKEIAQLKASGAVT